MDLTVEVDGPLSDYMQALTDSLSLTSGSYRASNGETLSLAGRLKTFDEMSFEEGRSFEELDKDRLYGSKVKLKGVYSYSDGSTETREQDIYLYRWLEVVAAQDASVATGKTAAFHKKEDWGLGKFVKEKEVDLRLPMSVATKFQGKKSEFNYGGELTGSQTVNWLYKGEKNQHTEDSLKVQVGGLEVGELVASATAIEAGVYIGYRPFPSISNTQIDSLLDFTVGRAKHLSIILVPKDMTAFSSLDIFKPLRYKNVRYGIISGWFGSRTNTCGLDLNLGEPLPLISIPWGLNNLVASTNERTDEIQLLQGLVPVSIPSGQDNTKFIDNLIKANEDYANNPDAIYFPVPSAVLNLDTYNSNSYVSGVIAKAGGVLPDLGVIAPGAERPLPLPFVATTSCELGL